MALEKTEAGIDQMVVTDAPSELITLSQLLFGTQDISLGGVSVLAGIADVKAVSRNEQDARLISNLNWRVATRQDNAEALQALRPRPGTVSSCPSWSSSWGLLLLISSPV